jgi:hypothetical protein
MLLYRAPSSGNSARVGKIIDQDLDRFGLMAAVHRAIDSRFDSASAPAGYNSANLDQLHAQSMARVNSSIDGWTERAYESGDWRLLFVLGMWLQDLFNIDLQSVRSSTTVVATEEGEIRSVRTIRPGGVKLSNACIVRLPWPNGIGSMGDMRFSLAANSCPLTDWLAS